METRTIKLNGAPFILGKKYRDNLTGCAGMATAGISYLTGCDQLLLAWNDTTGRPVEHWCHVTNIEAVKVAARKGGPAPSIGMSLPRHP